MSLRNTTNYCTHMHTDIYMDTDMHTYIEIQTINTAFNTHLTNKNENHYNESRR